MGLFFVQWPVGSDTMQEKDYIPRDPDRATLAQEENRVAVSRIFAGSVIPVTPCTCE